PLIIRHSGSAMLIQSLRALRFQSRVLALSLLWISTAFAKTFQPEPADVCGSPADRQPIDPKLVVLRLFASDGISDATLDVTGGAITALDRTNAIVDHG